MTELFSDFRSPIAECEIRNPRKLSNVSRDQGRPGGTSCRCDDEIVRPDRRAFAFQMATNVCVVFDGIAGEGNPGEAGQKVIDFLPATLRIHALRNAQKEFSPNNFRNPFGLRFKLFRPIRKPAFLVAENGD